MAAYAFTPIFHTPQTPSVPISQSLQFSNFIKPRIPIPRKPIKPLNSRISAILSDPLVLQIAETLEDSLPISPPLQKLRDTSSESLLSTPWPTKKDEPFRFTDTSLIKNSQILPISPPSPQRLNLSTDFSDTHFPKLTLVDGYIANSLSDSSSLPDGVFVGSLCSLDSDGVIAKRVAEFVPGVGGGDLFWSLNGVGAPDLVVVYVPEGCVVEESLHLRYISSEGSDQGSKKLPVSSPRVLVVVEKGGKIQVVEEYVGEDGDDKCYWVNSVVEVVICEAGEVSHSYLQNQSLNAAHIKWTSVRQESKSTYKLIEASTGGKLSRHNVHVQQFGPDTTTELSTFHLAGSDQTQDLHSKLVLDHPRGVSKQLHKCIVAHSLGQAVFDGNVKVNRYAQQTDAGQLTRSLLLEPRATVNVKPNLQIIADDVKCSHGATISDLEEDQLFYLQARGVDGQTARRALIYSFSAEVIQQFPSKYVREKVESQIQKMLEPALSSS